MISRSLLSPWLLILSFLQTNCINAAIEGVDARPDPDPPLCDAAFGMPKHCLSTLIVFDRVIADRGYGMNDLVEFLHPEAAPQHASQYPHETIDAGKYTFLLLGDPSQKHEVCVLNFGIGNFGDSVPSSIVLTHATMRATAKNLIEVCCYGKYPQSGGYTGVLEGAGTVIDVSVFSASSFDEEVREARKKTVEYRPSRSVGEPSTESPGNSDQNETTESEVSDEGSGESLPVGPSDKGKGVARVYCNKSQQPTTCKPGFGCFTKALANQVVLWGLTMDSVHDFIGTCAVTTGSS
ncbi:MAG: hypothetical protein M1812_006588 [Candelaria pacifica]|nr:MAG: hypothetical protein M1812_006588 [Candelaria pacifica]